MNERWIQMALNHFAWSDPNGTFLRCYEIEAAVESTPEVATQSRLPEAELQPSQNEEQLTSLGEASSQPSFAELSLTGGSLKRDRAALNDASSERDCERHGFESRTMVREQMKRDTVEIAALNAEIEESEQFGDYTDHPRRNEVHRLVENKRNLAFILKNWRNETDNEPTSSQPVSKKLKSGNASVKSIRLA
jgi:hypothetical protein